MYPHKWNYHMCMAGVVGCPEETQLRMDIMNFVVCV